MELNKSRSLLIGNKWPFINVEIIGYFAIVLTTLAGNSSISIKPILIGSYVEYLELSPEIAGYILTAEMSAAALGTIFAALRVHVWNRRAMGVLALGLILIGNVISCFVDNALLLGVVRSITGLGHGLMLAITAAAIASLGEPDRVVGINTIASTALAALLVFLIPSLQENIGIVPLYVVMGLLVIPAFLFISYFPEYRGNVPVLAVVSETNDKGDTAFRGNTGGVVTAVIVAICFYYLGIGSFWPYAEQIGRSVGLSYQDASKIIGYATIAGIIGALLATIIGRKFGRILPISIALIVPTLALISLLIYPNSVLVYKLATVLYMFSWFLFFPYLLGFISQLDPTGRLNSIVYTFALVGFSAGPALAGYLITLGVPVGEVKVSNLVWMAMVCFIPSFSILYAVYKHESLKTIG